MRRAFQQISTGDFHLEKIQKNIQAALSDVSNLPELNASLIQLDTAIGVDIIVNHLLGRDFTGYQVVRSSADVRVWDSPTVNNNSAKQLILRASGTATITLRVT